MGCLIVKYVTFVSHLRGLKTIVNLLIFRESQLNRLKMFATFSPSPDLHLFTRAQLKAGTGLKMQMVRFFNVTLLGIYR